MKFEHFALNVPEPGAMSQWYAEHLGCKILRSREETPFTHFLADETGRVFIELYRNPNAIIPNYREQPPLCFHFAFVSVDAAADRARLEKVGAHLFLEEPQPDGTMLIMMRDPWGIPLQLCQRKTTFRI